MQKYIRGGKVDISKIKIYVQTDINKTVTDINSAIFISDITDWTQIDEGNGDRYAHAQSQYLNKGLMDAKGRYNYKYDNDNELVELTEEEKKVLFPPILPAPTETEQLKQELTTVQEALDFLIMNGGI